MAVSPAVSEKKALAIFQHYPSIIAYETDGCVTGVRRRSSDYLQKISKI